MARTRIIIVDNSLFMRIMLSHVLERLEFEIAATAKDGREALDKYFELKPDIMLIDLVVADLDDFAVVRAILNQDPSAIINLMIPERLDEPGVIVDAVRAGVKGHIREPISPDELEALLGKPLRKISKGCICNPARHGQIKHWEFTHADTAAAHDFL